MVLALWCLHGTPQIKIGISTILRSVNQQSKSKADALGTNLLERGAASGDFDRERDLLEIQIP